MAGSLHEWRSERAGSCIIYEGVFLSPDGKAVFGRIVENERRPTDVYLWDPPKELRSNHKHGPCWQLVRPGQLWFQLHWGKPAWDFESSWVYVEQMRQDSILAGGRAVLQERSGYPSRVLLILDICIVVFVVIVLLLLLSSVLGS